MCRVVTVFTLSNIESNKSKGCPALPEAWVPANADTHAEPFWCSEVLEKATVPGISNGAMCCSVKLDQSAPHRKTNGRRKALEFGIVK